MLPREQETFKDAMSKHRVCVGADDWYPQRMLPWLCQIRNITTDDPKDMKKILDYILAASILHNLLLDCKIPDEWVDRDDVSSIDDPDRAQSQDDELTIAVPVGSGSDQRRQQLMHYFNEFHVIS
jgi:hypothetical protein